jgi:hypothetical protein
VKYLALKGVQTQHFGIDQYLCMSDAALYLKELSLKFHVEQ